MNTDSSTRPVVVDDAVPEPSHANLGGSDTMDDRARRLFLANRRLELMAPVNAIVEFCRMLLEEEKIKACPLYFGDLNTICEHAVRLADMIEKVLNSPQDERETEGASPASIAHALNHDMRGLLTVVIGYSEDLVRDASKYFLESFAVELDQIYKLGNRSTSLIDGILEYLHQPHGKSEVAGALDDYSRVIEQISPQGGEAAATEPGRLLVVEDNEDIRKVLARLLQRQGHVVEVAVDGVEAIQLVQSSEFDLVLLDIMMPRANGFHVLAHFKADPRLRLIPVIMITGLNEFDGVVRCLEMGAEDYLTKPFDRVILKARVDACLEKKRLRDQSEREKQRYNELLHVILPSQIVSELAENDVVKPRRFENVAVLFADIVNFTPYCDRHSPEHVVGQLQELVVAWEEIALDCSVQKVKTIGDAFMAASGLLEPSAAPVRDCVRCGLRMIEATQRLPIGWDLRVGVHVGAVVAGVLGRRQYLYDLFGDTVNTAARLESHGKPGSVSLSETAWRQISAVCKGESRDSRYVKGKGEMEMIHVGPTATLT